MLVRPVHPDEYARLGALTLEAYASLPGHVHEPEYEEELYDVRTRAEAPATDVVVAIDDDGETLLGGVTFVADHTSPYAEDIPAGGAGVRMLAVDVAAQGRGIGTMLVQWCIDRARAEGKSVVVLHSTPWMTAAHHIYERFGFVRDPDRDWSPSPDVPLLGFRLEIS